VLAAEREAREAVEHCRAEAARILAQAEERVRGIRHRAEQRIRLAHRIADRAVEHTLLDLRGLAAEPGEAITKNQADEVLDQALDLLIDEILDGPG
jgi:cell division septum initiation protein DivIVA